jgi:allantoin racemase
MTRLPVLVINPNSSVQVTQAIDRAVNGAGAAQPPRFECLTLHEGPPGVISQADADRAAVLVTGCVAAREAEASAFVIACFSDPGIVAARERTRKPVIGIGEAGMLAALALGRQVGVIAVAQPSIPRHMRYWHALALAQRVAAERALDLTVEQSGSRELAFERMCEAGRALRERDGADVLLLGCAGMADLRAPLEQALGMPVVEPCEAAAALALWRVDALARMEAA